MKWKTKAHLYKVISKLPYNNDIQYQLQKRITQSLPRTLKEEYIEYLDFHINNLKKNAKKDLRYLNTFEFGAGWDLFYNIGLWCAGIGRQTIVDLEPKLRLSLVNNEIRRFASLSLPDILERHPNPNKDLVKNTKDLELFGIFYRAPFDARNTGFDSESFDAVVSTNTFEHIPPNDIKAILHECKRFLKPGGIISARVDYVDHFHYSDKSIRPFNFLRFDENDWGKYNSPAFFQNRLRHKQYVSLFSEAGFNIVTERKLYDYGSDLLSDVNEMFSEFTHEELTVSGGLFCLVKQE